MPRSPAHWATNHYRDPAAPPAPTTPYGDLHPAAAQRFRAARTGLLAIPGVGETVKHMGELWGWAWEYGVGSRKLCWLHVLEGDVSATFTLSAEEDRVIAEGPRLGAAIADAVDRSQRTGPVRWCSLDLHEQRTVAAFLDFARRKAEHLGPRPIPRRPRG